MRARRSFCAISSAAKARAPMLELKGLSKHFGGIRAVDDLTINVREGEIFGLIGPNGSGKSTTVNLICGLFPVTAGQIPFRGADITVAQPHQCGGARVPRPLPNIPLLRPLT